MEALFEFLFKYRPVVFEKGRLAFAAGLGTYIVVALVVAIGIPALIAYNYLSSRADRLIIEIEGQASRMLTRLRPEQAR